MARHWCSKPKRGRIKKNSLQEIKGGAADVDPSPTTSAKCGKKSCDAIDGRHRLTLLFSPTRNEKDPALSSVHMLSFTHALES